VNVLRSALVSMSLLVATGRVVAQHMTADETDIRGTIMTMQGE
jgi:hypothetical protein